MSHDVPGDQNDAAPESLGERPELADAQPETEPPASTSWPAVSGPWGTPGDHLTGPIPRIRRREDGTLTHGEES